MGSADSSNISIAGSLDFDPSIPLPAEDDKDKERCKDIKHAEMTTCIRDATEAFRDRIDTDCQKQIGIVVHAGPAGGAGMSGDYYKHCVTSAQAQQSADIASCKEQKAHAILLFCR